jgi:predicted nucleotidyltransferase
VDQAARVWAQVEAERHPELQRLGYFGSYARGGWSVGSDLDLVAIVDRSSEPFERRCLTWDATDLPVPAELLVYTADEWEGLRREGGRFVRVLEREVVWIYRRAD